LSSVFGSPPSGLKVTLGGDILRGRIESTLFGNRP